MSSSSHNTPQPEPLPANQPEPPPGRKRGRPKKIVEAPSLVKAKRGRPRKAKDISESIEIARLQSELEEVHKQLALFKETCSSQEKEIRIMGDDANEKAKIADLAWAELEEQKRIVQELQVHLIEGEKLRRQLRNTIMELKGNIRVFCRVRPLLSDDGVGADASVVSYPTSLKSKGRGIILMRNGQEHPFTFDKVFSHEASQRDIFVEISQLIQSALDGYKVCIFAYGQRGSGKTYTMIGNPEAEEHKGLIPRSLEQIFEATQSLLAQGWQYTMKASVLEIYNETIRDLLSTSQAGGPDLTRTRKHCEIKHDAEGNIHVSDLTIVNVCNISEISALLREATQSRSVGKTLMNASSSRSHFVFTLQIAGVNKANEERVEGVLNLIDLAGSERASSTGETADRMTEARAINKSLTSLSDVMVALRKKQEHIPYRNSKLTHLLQPYLGGDSKTLMFVNISPHPDSVNESFCSLQFARTANASEIGNPRKV